MFPKLNEAAPTEKWHLQNHIYVIMHCIYLGRFCIDYEAINKFLIFFWRCINAAGTTAPGTRASTIYEMRASSETHMKFWEDLTEKSM